jgi:hypothetical protein
LDPSPAAEAELAKNETTRRKKRGMTEVIENLLDAGIIVLKNGARNTLCVPLPDLTVPGTLRKQRHPSSRV